MDGVVSASQVLERFTWLEPDESDEPDAEVDVLLKRLDREWRTLLEACGQHQQDLMEIFLQLGRRPKAIFDNGRSREAVFLTNGALCERVHIDRFIDCLGWRERLSISKAKSLCFPTTLHRVSLITKGVGADLSIIGINIRIGKSVTGIMLQMCPWLLNPKPMRVFQGAPPLCLAGKSVLFIGRPGSGKTTLLREMAQSLSRSRERDILKTVIVVDKMNEIAGDFEVPHVCIGEARWMPCSSPEMLPQIMREAVDCNNPDVVLVDEICTTEEVRSACGIVERGVNLISTVHGNTLVDTLNCTVRQALLGGVAGPDEKGPHRRAGAPACDVVIELHQKDRWILHPNARYAIDTLLKGEAVEAVELRPGLAVSTWGIPVDDSLSYSYQCTPSMPSRLLSSSGALGRLPCTASLLEEESSIGDPGTKNDTYASTESRFYSPSPPGPVHRRSRQLQAAPFNAQQAKAFMGRASRSFSPDKSRGSNLYDTSTSQDTISPKRRLY